jgi:cellulose synthase/poly-beta-1,6-N-acetylglucosamine synthase-like glycosyltransferase
MSQDLNLEIASFKDLENKKERILYRFFEILPGFLSLTTLFFAVVFSWKMPVLVAYFIITFDIYYTLKAFNLVFYETICFRKMKKNLSLNWKEKFQKVFSDKEPYMLIILPTYKEKLNIIEETFESIKNSTYPKEKIIVVLSQEERAGKEHVEKIAKGVLNKYENSFKKLIVTLHPKDIPGEFPGKGANVYWAGERAKEYFLKETLPIQNTIVCLFDIDTKVFPDFFYKLAFDYLDSKNPERLSYQPIPVYHNNIWTASPVSRVVAISNTFWQMRMQEKPEYLVTYSSHAMSFKTFLDVGFPKNVVSDDSRIFWKCYLKYDGKYGVKPMFYPISMDAVESKGFLKTIISLYKQQRRWAWGVIEIPYVMYGFIKNKNIPLKKKIKHTLNLLEGFWSWACAALLILFLGWLPVIIGGEKFKATVLSFNLPKLTSNIMTFAGIGMVFSALTNLIFLPPMPKEIKRTKKIIMILQWFLTPISLICFGSIPALDAQIRLLIGKRLDFFVTPKERGQTK